MQQNSYGGETGDEQAAGTASTGGDPQLVFLPDPAAVAAAAAAATGGQTISNFTFQAQPQPQQHLLQQHQNQHQHQQQFVFQQPFVLQGKPMVPMQHHSGGSAGSGNTQQQGMPLVSLPGGNFIQPHMTFQGSGGGGYPQLVGLPPGMGTVPTLVSQTAGSGTHQQQQQQHHQALQPLSMQHPGFPGAPLAVAVKLEPGEDRPSSSHSANTSAGGLGSDGSPHVQGSGGTPGSAGGNKSRYRGVSYDRKKAKWRVQIKVAALGKSGVSVGYFDTEEAAARAYDRAAIGLLGRDNPNLQTNFDLVDYAEEPIPRLTGKSREEVKTTLKSERIKQAPRRRFTSRQRTSRFMGVGSSNRKNQWQARILVHGKVTHLGYYETEEEAARVYDRVSLALHGAHAQTNFAVGDYTEEEVAPYRGLDREDLQRALGVKPMDKSSRFRGVSKKKGKWEAKVMVNRRWAYRELFDSEEEAARAYDRALWRLKPREARSYVNFKDEIPADADALAAAAAATGDFRGAASDGDMVDSEGAGFGEEEGYLDEGDFEYEYRPTKGTRRSVSMRAKRAGSMPNLVTAPASAGGSAGRGPAIQKQPQSQGQNIDLLPAGSSGDASTAPSFVPLPGGGLQLRFDPVSGGLLPAATSAEEPLLIRVGSETHVLPHHGPVPGTQTLGKRTGLQRIQSEPQFMGGHRENPGADSDLLTVPGANAGDIHDLMNDKDLFRGLDLADLAAMAGGTPRGCAPGGSSGQGLDLNAFAMDFMSGEAERDGGGGAFAGLFEDEELALANLEFSRPRKIPKSMSMSQLSALGGAEEEAALPSLQSLQDAALRPGADPLGKPPLPSRPSGQAPAEQTLGALGQPIRRIHTFTASLPSFEEGEEKPGAHEGEGMGVSGIGIHPPDEDLVKQFLDPMPLSSTLDDAMRMLGEHA